MNNLEEVFCMAAGDSTSSYAANSNFQGNAITTAKPLVKLSVKEICSTMLPGQQLVVADLGCSYGPNVFSMISQVMDAIDESCRHPLEVQFFLNDLPANDFNSVFRSLASYKKKVKEERGEELAGSFYIAGVPGSFHGRLFPSRTVNLFHSSCSVHWLSQVPEGLKDEHNNELNKGNIYVGETSPPCVHEAYLLQFQKDFSAFLRCRSEEIQDGGLIVLTLVVKRSSDLNNGAPEIPIYELFAEVLMSMANEGIIKEADIDSFNIPFYDPSIEEFHAIVNDQGAFEIAGEVVMELNGEDFDDYYAQGKLPSSKMRGQSAAKLMRAILETLFATHFGGNVVDDIFSRLASILPGEFEKGAVFTSPCYVVTLRKHNTPKERGRETIE